MTPASTLSIIYVRSVLVISVSEVIRGCDKLKERFGKQMAPMGCSVGMSGVWR